MVSAMALVLVLLQLHASDTLKEDNEVVRPQSPAASHPQPPPPSGGTQIPARGQQPQRGISRQDEDLLDLMVRIAETPEEWERIHRVLSLIGREKDSYDTTKNVEKTDSVQNIENVKNVTENEIQPLLINNSSFKTTTDTSLDPNIVTSPTTTVPLTNTPASVKETDIQASALQKIEDTDSGWPDFEEAIVKKVKISHAVDENDIYETNWLEDDWLDPNWNNYLSGDKKPLSFSQSEDVSPVSFKTSMDKPKPSFEKVKAVPRSRLYQDPKILEFPLKNVVSFQNHTVEHNTTEDTNGSSSRGGRPVFVYHRVTTSPQERRGNSAIIAVSVVRQGPGEAPASTTQPPHTLWDRILRIQDPVKDSPLPKHQRKHPHWRQEVHWQHNRGRRHHHTHEHTHAHTHH